MHVMFVIKAVEQTGNEENNGSINVTTVYKISAMN